MSRTAFFFAQVEPDWQAAEFQLFSRHLLGSIVFSVVGLLVFLGALWLIAKFSPFCVVKEIEEDQNTALAIIIGSVLIGIAIIIGAAIQG